MCKDSNGVKANHKPINSRLVEIRMKGKHINTTIIQWYAPTNDSEGENKGAFCEQLQAKLNSIPGHEIKIVVGDFNPKAGNDNTSYKKAMGKEGCGSMNNKGKCMNKKSWKVNSRIQMITCTNHLPTSKSTIFLKKKGTHRNSGMKCLHL